MSEPATKPVFDAASGAHTAATAPALASIWVASPWRARPARTGVLAACAVALAALVGFVAADWLWGALALAAFTLVTLRAFVPTRYAADASGIAIHGPLRSQRCLWSAIWRVAVDPAGDALFLATTPGRRPRGVTILLDTPGRAEWIAHLRAAHSGAADDTGTPVAPGTGGAAA